MASRSSLNHVYRTVWNEALGAMVAVAENAPSHQGGGASGALPSLGFLTPLALAVALVWGAMPQAHANPEGGVAIHGQASMVSSGNNLTVTTQNGAGTNHSAINWQSFSIPAGSTTQIIQPSAASMSINRVVTNTPSLLFGTLSSNGQVVLVNQAGIAVGTGALVDTAGFTASAVGMTAQDAMAGHLRFAGDGLTTNSGALMVQGNIIARGGDVVLIAPSIELAQTAVVESQGGNVMLAAGQSVEVTGRGLEGITLLVQAPSDQAVNLGTLRGDAVGIFAGNLKHSGLIQATQSAIEGGKVVLKASGDAYVEGNGRIEATSTIGKGGTIQVLGERVAVMDNAVLDASGTTGGGTVLVGGDYQGKNAAVKNASVVYFGSDAIAKANASNLGDGGKVIVWADDTTRYAGLIEAKGGVQGGNGGFVETSGKRILQASGLVDASATAGKAGTWLLDPNNIAITSSTDLNFSGTTSAGTYSILSSADSAFVGVTTIQSALNVGTNVSITTSTAGGNSQAGDIVVGASVLKSGGGDATLTLVAHNDIVITTGLTISSTTGKLNVVLTADSDGNGTGSVSLLPTGSSVTTNDGNFQATGTSIALGGNINAGTGAVTLKSSNGGVSNSTGVQITASTLEVVANSGSIDINGQHRVSSFAASATGAGSSIDFRADSTSGLSVTTVGSTTGVSAPGQIVILNKGNLDVNANVSSSSGNVSIIAQVASGAQVTVAAGKSVTATGGSVALQSESGGGLNLNGTVDAFTTLTLRSFDGNITHAGAGSLKAGGNTIINAGSSGNILLSGASGVLGGKVNLTGNKVLFQTGGNLDLSPAATESTLTRETGQELYLQAGSLLSLPLGLIYSSGNLTLKSGTTLTTNGNLDGLSINLYGPSGISIGHNVNASTTLNMTASNGAVNQTAGAVTATGGQTTVSAGGAVTLNQSGNNFKDFSTTAGGAVSLTDSNAITLNGVNAGGTVNMTAGGTGFLVTGGFAATGATTLNANTTLSGATVKPGKAGGISSFAVNGNLTMSGSSIFELDFASPTSYDTVTVSGVFDATTATESLVAKDLSGGNLSASFAALTVGSFAANSMPLVFSGPVGWTESSDATEVTVTAVPTAQSTANLVSTFLEIFEDALAAQDTAVDEEEQQSNEDLVVDGVQC